MWACENQKIIKRARKLAEAFQVSHGKKFRLKNYDSAETLDFVSEGKEA